MKGKQQLDGTRMNFVKKAIGAYAPVSPRSYDVYWKKQCVSAIDEGCRRLKRSKVKLNLS